MEAEELDGSFLEEASQETKHVEAAFKKFNSIDATC